ncbi:MAG TPA: Rieske (2Fe-2S) protein [Nocardioidaceae bacterium]|nr:Rieske (2Fe-2S) protein [Nocardioidaceae bacterium]
MVDETRRVRGTTEHEVGPGDASRELSRRSVLRGAAVGGLALPLVAACGSNEPDVPAGEVTVAASDVPVGGGTIMADEKVVVTQPAEGDFRAFSAVCTHQGCPVQTIAEGTINCPCHGSQFSVEDGSVVTGPATSPLKTLAVTREGDDLVVG